MINCLIIDDEMNARNAIKSMLDFYCKDVIVVGEAEDVKSGLLSIHKHKPDLVFLDIKMSDGTGIDLLRKLQNIPFKVIFITAHDHYAIQAFKFSAIDYLLKPIDPKEFVEAVRKAKELSHKNDFKIKLDSFRSNLNPDLKNRKKIVLKTSKSIHLIKIEDIIRCEADKCYTEFFMQNGKRVIVSKVLKEFDELLSPYGFIRPHQSHLVNLNYIESYQKNDGGYILMSNKASIPVSSRKKESILKLFESL